MQPVHEELVDLIIEFAGIPRDHANISYVFYRPIGVLPEGSDMVSKNAPQKSVSSLIFEVHFAFRSILSYLNDALKKSGVPPKSKLIPSIPFVANGWNGWNKNIIGAS